MAASLRPEQLRRSPWAGEWSANEVLSHLRSCADVWGIAIARLLAEDRPPIRAIDPRTWVESTDYRELEFQLSLQAFTAQRLALLETLNILKPADWARSTTVTGAGAPLERSVQDYAGRLARHERSHYRPLARIIKALGLA